MITTEYYGKVDGVDLYRTYSTTHHYIQRNDGIIYEEAIDPMNSNRTYTETNIDIISGDTNATHDAQEAIQILLYGEELNENN